MKFALIETMLNSDIDEMQLCVNHFKYKNKKILKVRNEQEIQTIKKLYLQYLSAVDHWDLVDESVDSILGEILAFQKQELICIDEFNLISSFNDSKNGFPELILLSKSNNIWQVRISIVSQFAFLKRGNANLPLSICKFHLKNSKHYVQKVLGWTLREIRKNK